MRKNAPGGIRACNHSPLSLVALLGALSTFGLAERAGAAQSVVAQAGVPQTEPVKAGLYRCHLGDEVHIRNLAPDLGSLVLRFQGRDHLLFAVDTESGALRYEDRRSGWTWIKIPGKSMLLDSRMGEPLANDCIR